jgi:hypothetical protein
MYQKGKAKQRDVDEVARVVSLAGGAAGLGGWWSGAELRRALSGAAVLSRGGVVSEVSLGRGVAVTEAKQNFVGRVLQPSIRLVKFASGLGGQLAKLIPVLHVGKRPKNQI